MVEKKILPHRGCFDSCFSVFLLYYFYVLKFESTWLTKTAVSMWEDKVINKLLKLILKKKKKYWSLRFSHVFSSITEFSKGILAVINQIFSVVTEIILEKSVMLDLLIAEMLTVRICFKSSLSYVFYRKPVLAIFGKSSWKASASCYI